MCMADKFPESLPGFQKMFPDDAACAKYLEAIRWRDGFQCPKCAVALQSGAGPSKPINSRSTAHVTAQHRSNDQVPGFARRAACYDPHVRESGTVDDCLM